MTTTTTITFKHNSNSVGALAIHKALCLAIYEHNYELLELISSVIDGMEVVDGHHPWAGQGTTKEEQ